MKRLFSPLLIGAQALITSLFALAAEPARPVTVSWAGDVLPALEGTISCRVFNPYDDADIYAVIGKYESNKQTHDSVTKAVLTVVAKKATLSRLIETQIAYDKACDRLSLQEPANAINLNTLRHDFAQELFSDPVVLTIVMPDIHKAFSASGASCPDCPGPATCPPVQPVTIDDLMPCLVEYAQYTRILEPSGREIHYVPASKCTRLVGPEERPMASLAFYLLKGNACALRAIQRLERRSYRGVNKKTLTVSQQIEHEKAYLAEHLGSDSNFMHCIWTAASNDLRDLGFSIEQQ